MAKLMRSIWGREYARLALAALPSADLGMAGHYKTPQGIRISSRRSYQWRSNGKTGRDRETLRHVTGGVVIEGGLPMPTYGNRPFTFTRRLRPDWTEAQFIAATDDILIRCRAALQLQRCRESVYAAAGDLETNPTFCAAVEAEESRYGSPSCYDTMTEADCEHWLAWLASWKAANGAQE